MRVLIIEPKELLKVSVDSEKLSTVRKYQISNSL